MPKYKPQETPKPEVWKKFQDWRKQEPSVMDSIWEAPVKKGLDVAESFLPTGSPEDLMNPMATGSVAAPLVSIFKNATERLASNAANKARVGHLRDLMKRVGAAHAGTKEGRMFDTTADNYADAYSKFEKKYPRVAAHMDLDVLPIDNFYGQTIIGVPKGKKVPMRVGASTFENFSDPQQGKQNAEELFFHEGNHVAQRLGNEDLTLINLLADKIGQATTGTKTGAYLNNPIEQRSFAAGFKNAGYKNPQPKPFYTKLNEMVQEADKYPQVEAAKNALIDILKRRGKYDPNVKGQLHSPADTMRDMADVENTKVGKAFKVWR